MRKPGLSVTMNAFAARLSLNAVVDRDTFEIVRTHDHDPAPAGGRVLVRHVDAFPGLILDLYALAPDLGGADAVARLDAGAFDAPAPVARVEARGWGRDPDFVAMLIELIAEHAPDGGGEPGMRGWPEFTRCDPAAVAAQVPGVFVLGEPGDRGGMDTPPTTYHAVFGEHSVWFGRPAARGQGEPLFFMPAGEWTTAALVAVLSGALAGARALCL